MALYKQRLKIQKAKTNKAKKRNSPIHNYSCRLLYS